jgi:hypothetical protein
MFFYKKRISHRAIYKKHFNKDKKNIKSNTLFHHNRLTFVANKHNVLKL